MIVGKKIADRVSGVDIGSTINIQRKNWKVVGLFTADDSSFESEIWGDYDAMAPAIGRNGGCESLTVRLTNPSVLAAFDKDLRANPQFQVQADSEQKYYENLAGSTGTVLIALASFVAIVMGIGAVFGAMNTMYAIVSQRTREIGTLRALGFSRFSILFSFVMESVLLAIVGGLLGCLIALPMNGYTAGNWNQLPSANWHSPSRSHRRAAHRPRLRRADGLCRRTAAGLPRRKHADHASAAGSVERPQFAFRFSLFALSSRAKPRNLGFARAERSKHSHGSGWLPSPAVILSEDFSPSRRTPIATTILQVARFFLTTNPLPLAPASKFPARSPSTRRHALCAGC